MGGEFIPAGVMMWAVITGESGKVASGEKEGDRGPRYCPACGNCEYDGQIKGCPDPSRFTDCELEVAPGAKEPPSGVVCRRRGP